MNPEERIKAVKKLKKRIHMKPLKQEWRQ